jgi:hypothetical protein
MLRNGSLSSTGGMLVLSLFSARSALSDEAVGETDNQIETHANDSAASQKHVKVLPCRPTLACTAELVPAGTWEVEAGYSARRASAAMFHAGQLLLKYSILDPLQMQLATNNVFSASPGNGSPSYFDGGFVGPKVQFNNQGTVLPIFSLSAFLAFPTRSELSAQQRTYDAYVWTYLRPGEAPT